MKEKHLFCEILRDLFAVTNHSLAAVFFAIAQITSINYSYWLVRSEAFIIIIYRICTLSTAPETFGLSGFEKMCYTNNIYYVEIKLPILDCKIWSYSTALPPNYIFIMFPDNA